MWAGHQLLIVLLKKKIDFATSYFFERSQSPKLCCKNFYVKISNVSNTVETKQNPSSGWLPPEFQFVALMGSNPPHSSHPWGHIQLSLLLTCTTQLSPSLRHDTIIEDTPPLLNAREMGGAGQ
jgi:hypothetical protein